MADFRRLFYALALVALLAGLTVPASAQAAPFQCIANAGVPPLIRAEGWTELVGDLTLNCNGGVPTPAGQIVPPVNVSISISTNLTSRLLSGGLWSEALLIIDEPHSAVNPTRPILNCGASGALDSGLSGPNVCSIVATGNPVQTYDGTPNGYGVTGGTTATGATCQGGSSPIGATGNTPSGLLPVANSYGCGRPNVWQGRLGTAQDPNQYNAISWLGVPLDPPGTSTNRTIRITNIRADAHTLGISAPGNFFLNTVQMSIQINGNTALEINNPQQTVADVVVGLVTSIKQTNFSFLQCVGEHNGITNGNVFPLGSTTPTTTTFTSTPGQTSGVSVFSNGVPEFQFQEGFGSSWKAKNIAHILSSTGTNPGNGVTVTNASYWSYDGFSSAAAGTMNYPKDFNQNVPGAIYNTESGFMYPGAAPTGCTSLDTTAGDPTPNPPFGIGTVAVTIASQALSNSTCIANAGIADQGTRLQVTISNVPAGSYVLVPEAIFLTNGTCSLTVTSCNSGVAVLVTTDAAGAGAYTAVTTGASPLAASLTYTPIASTGTGGMAVYEVLFADPFSIETAVVPAIVAYQPNLNLNQPSPTTTAQAFGGFAPFYSTAAAHEPQPLSLALGGVALPVPRFAPGTVPANPNFFDINKCACNLLFPFVSAQAGYDTGIAIANTSQDNLGIAGNSAALQQFGGVEFWYYGTGNNGGTAPPAQCTNAASPGTCPAATTVPAGQILTYVLSSGGGSIGAGANGLDNRANGFAGYIIAQAQFQYCHAYAFITAVGAGPLSQAVSEGYLGLILDNSSWNCNSGAKVAGLCRTGQSAENLVH